MPAHFSRMRHVVCHVDYIEVPWYLLHHHVKPFILQWHTFAHIWQLRLIIPQYSCLLYLHLFLCLNSWISQERLVAVVQYLSCLLLYYSLFTYHMVQPIFVPLLILYMVLPAFTSYISTSSISFCPYITSSSNQVSHKVVVNE